MSAVLKLTTELFFCSEETIKGSAIAWLFRGVFLPKTYSSFKEHRQGVRGRNSDMK